ncbi:nucleotidyltransferase domain-containing protein [Pleurocapsa sp. PCC 7319]|uniref:nucleotidyltransferase domain-containing protein n=1 Tax=Pleurocapsa sp. PCC 7319 TaxID=118161 RepID=UPI000344E918|nr:nucleotidyltransferase domain-containing protein [Pleurocapsa sp. PCC 7319]
MQNDQLIVNKTEKYVPLDIEGYLLNDLNFDRISDALKDIINLLKKAILSHEHYKNIHSIYMRGSIARGKIYVPLSDIDLIVLFYQDTSIRELKKKLSKIIQEVYSENMKIDIYGVNYQALSRNTQFSLKINSICIYGVDVSEKIQKFKPDKSICFLQQSFVQDVQTAKADLRALKTLSFNDMYKQPILKIYGWIAKRILRVGLEL